MNVMPSLSICEIQDHVCTERREKQTENKVGVGLLVCAAVGRVCRGHRAGFNKKAGKGAFLGTPRFNRTRCKVLFSL